MSCGHEVKAIERDKNLTVEKGERFMAAARCVLCGSDLGRISIISESGIAPDDPKLLSSYWDLGIAWTVGSEPYRVASAHGRRAKKALGLEN